MWCVSLWRWLTPFKRDQCTKFIPINTYVRVNWLSLNRKSILNTRLQLRLLADDDKEIRPPQDRVFLTLRLIKLRKNAITSTQRIHVVPTSHIYNHVVSLFEICHGVSRWRHSILNYCRRTPWKPLNRLVTNSEWRYNYQVEQVVLHARLHRISR